MNDWIEHRPEQFLARLEHAASRTATPCGDETMVWHLWGDADSPVLVLFHGGAGSWRHWAHNIDVLSQTYRLLVPDLPGLGESAFPPNGDDRCIWYRSRAAGGCAIRCRWVLVWRCNGNVRRRDPWRASAVGDDHRVE